MFELYTWIAPECDFELLREVSVEHVAAHYVRTYERGRHGQAPTHDLIGSLASLEPLWVEVRVPLRYLDYQRGDEAGRARVAQARLYALGNRELPTGTASYGKHAQYMHATRGKPARAGVHDGNHRALAMEMRGGCSFRVFMAKSQYEALRRDVK